MPNSTIETTHSVPERVFVTIPHAPATLPLVPNQSFDNLRRKVRQDFKKQLAALDADLAAFRAPATSSRKRRWWR